METGTIIETKNYENGLIDNSETKIIKSNKGDIVEKTYRYNSGKLEKIVRKFNGALEGLQETYYLNGAIQDENYYVNSKKEGIQTRYNKDGSLFCQYTYINDKKTRPFKRIPEGLDEGVFIMDEGAFDEEEKYSGQFTSYFGEDRVIIATEKFEKSHRVGIWKYYTPKNVLEKETNYCNFGSKKQNIKEYYIIDGASILKSDVNYTNTKIDGEFITYHENSKVKEKGSYLNGKKAGTWITYNDSGKKVSKRKYENNNTSN